MKNIFKIMMTVAIAIYSTSCDDIDSIHEKYYDLGGRPYIGVSDIQDAISGFEKAEVIWKISSDARIENCYLYWNNGADSAVVVPDRTDSVMRHIILLSEGAHIITMVNKSADGDVSLERTMPVAVYGEEYKASLVPQGISSISAPSASSGTINWAGLEGCVGMKVTYTKMSGQAATKMTWASEQRTLLADVKSGSTFTYESFYLPSANALDTVMSPIIGTGVFPAYYETLDRSDWTVTSSSLQPDWGSNEGLVDGNTETIWHNTEDLPTATLEVDMQKDHKVRSISLRQRDGYGDVKEVEFLISEDNSKWKSVGTLIFDGTHGEEKEVILNDGNWLVGRYIKVDIKSSNRNNSLSIAELVVTGE